MARKKKFRCHGCGKTTANNDLHCSPACKEYHDGAKELIVADLTARGFDRLESAPNVFSKDGVAVTVEEVHHHGIEKALTRHGSNVASIARARAERAAIGAGDAEAGAHS